MEQVISIDALTYGAAGIGYAKDSGKAVFVTGTCPGDVVLVQIDEDRKRFARGHVVEIIEPGKARVQPGCPYANDCGGCSWQHIAYEAQLEAKRANVVSALCRIGRFDAGFAEQVVDACRPSKRQLGYRNKLELATARDNQGRLVVGLNRASSHDVVPIESCLLAHESMFQVPKALSGALRYLEGSRHLGIYRIGVRHSIRTKSTEIALWTPAGAFPRRTVATTLGSTLHASSIVRVMANPDKQRKIKGVEVLAGHGNWHERFAGFDFRVSAPSFFQVNTAQAEVLVETALAGLNVDSDSVVADLYCGVGSFTLPLAKRAGRVIAVESAACSVGDLRRNADMANTEIDIIGGDSARELSGMGAIDALVVDPPRSGMAVSLPADIAQAGPACLAYISCNPTTWARDAARLDDCGYTLVRVTPVDLFPQTYHCELVSIFRKR